MIKKVFLILILFTCSVSADVPLDTLVVSTPDYESAEFKPELGTYEFIASWAGVPAATVYMTVDKEGLNYKLKTEVKTSKGIDLFYKLRYEASGVVSGVNLRPLTSEFKLNENSKTKSSKLIFKPDGSIESIYEQKGKDSTTYDFDPENLLLDPFSAAFLARSMDWEPGTERYFDTFNGRSRYLISFKSVGKETLKINGEERGVWVLKPRVRKLNTDKKSSKLKDAKIYVTADSKREIVKVKSEVFIGSVNTKIVSFTPVKESRVHAKNKTYFKFN